MLSRRRLGAAVVLVVRLGLVIAEHPLAQAADLDEVPTRAW
jgi:hypothetical protein